MSPTTDQVLVDTNDVDRKLASASKTVSATYRYPHQMHGPLGASASTAWVKDNDRDGLVVDAGRLPAARRARDRAGHAGAERPRALRRGLRPLRPLRRRQRLARRGGDLAGGRQARARAVHAGGRAQLGELRPCLRVVAPRRGRHLRRRSRRSTAWDRTAWTSSRGNRPGPPGNLPSRDPARLPRAAAAAVAAADAEPGAEHRRQPEQRPRLRDPEPARDHAHRASTRS